MGEAFRYINMPVCDLLVTQFPAWSASTNIVILTGLTLSSGISYGVSIATSGYISFMASAQS